MTNEILYFFGWWQFAVCLFAFLGLIAIWYHIGRKQKDRGQVYLALSILCWSISGAIDIYYSKQLPSTEGSIVLDGWHSVLSMVNSLLILLALPWFRHLPSQLKSIIQSKYWTLIVGLPFLFCLLPTLRRLISPGKVTWISELDVYYSILTLIVLGMVLWTSFVKRRLTSLAYLSAICILITFFAQLYKLTDNTINLLLFSGIFKTSLIMIFFALALSWVKDLITKVELRAEAIRLKARVSREEGKIMRKVLFEGVGKMDHEVKLSSKNFDLLSRFIKEAKEGQEWLEIKPRSEKRPNKHYDIHDHNEIKRMLSSVLDQIYGREMWTKTEHFDPLKEALFELDKENSRKIRLKVSSEQRFFRNVITY